MATTITPRRLREAAAALRFNGTAQYIDEDRRVDIGSDLAELFDTFADAMNYAGLPSDAPVAGQVKMGAIVDRILNSTGPIDPADPKAAVAALMDKLRAANARRP